MSTQVKENEHHMWFDSMEELEADVKVLPKKANSGRWEALLWRRSCSHRVSPTAWHGFNGTGADVVSVVREGWPEQLAKLQPRVERLRQRMELDTVTAATVQLRRRKRQRGDHGDALDMPRVWNGDLERAWERPVKVPRDVPTERYATLFADLSINWRVHADDTLWRAAAMLCTVEVLTRMGINTEIWSGVSSYNVTLGGPNKTWCAVRVKEFTQPLNEDRTAAMLSAAFFRVYGFGMMLCAPWHCSGHMGIPMNESMVQPLRDRAERGERVFRMGETLTEQGAIQEINKVIATLKAEKEAA